MPDHLAHNFGLLGYHELDGKPARRFSLHGPAYTEGDCAYPGYCGAGPVILDISDAGRPS